MSVSIILPVYNNTKYILETISSIYNAGIGIDYELIIGVDGCEKTLELFKSLEVNDITSVYYFNENVGPYIVRNSLTLKAKFDTLLFFDSDDIMGSEMLTEIEKQIKLVDMITPKMLNFIKLKNQYIEDTQRKRWGDGVFAIKKNIFMDLNGFEPWPIGADTEFNKRVQFNGNKIKKLDEVLFFRRLHNQSLTMSQDKGFNSKLRTTYSTLLRNKTRFDPLSKLHTANNIKITTTNEIKIEPSNLPKITDSGYNLTLIIPVFRNKVYLEECINSIINSIKDYNVEIMIGIDGCQETLDYIQSTVFPIPIKVYYFNENLGPYTIKNSLALISNSNKILFFDSDDIMNDNMIDEIIKRLNQYVCVKPKFIEFGGKSLGGTKFGEGVFGIRKDVFLSMNGFEPWMMAADSDFMGRLYKKRVSTLHTQLSLFKRRIHPNSLTNRKDTGLYSPQRAHFAKLSKNKRGDGNPEILHTRDYEIITETTNITNEPIVIKEKNLVLKILNKSQEIPTKEQVKTIDYEEVNKVTYTKKTNKKKKVGGVNSTINKNLNVKKSIYNNIKKNNRNRL